MNELQLETKDVKLEVKNLLQSIGAPIHFILNGETSFQRYIKAMDVIVQIYEKEDLEKNKKDIHQLIDGQFNFLFNYVSYMAEINNNRAMKETVYRYAQKLNMNRYISTYAIDMDLVYPSLNAENLLPTLKKAQELQITDLKCLPLIMRDDKKIYSSLKAEEKEEVIDLLSQQVSRDDGFILWKKSQLFNGVFLKKEIENAFKEVCHSSEYNHSGDYISKVEKQQAFDKTFFSNLITKNPHEHIKQYAIDTLINYDWSTYELDSGKELNFLRLLGEHKEYDAWLSLVRKFDSIFINKATETEKDAQSYLRYKTFPSGLIEYIVKEGTYQDFETIQPFMTKKAYGFNYDVWYQNKEHLLELSPLYEFVLRGKKREFQAFLSHYTYIDENSKEYLPSHSLNNHSNILFKDELATLFTLLNEHQEYGMLDSLNEFKHTHVPQEKVMSVPHHHTKKEFNFLTHLFLKLFSRKVIEQKNILQNNSHTTESTFHIAQNHAEFVHELNQYSKAIQEKLTFLNRKIKITSSLDKDVKDEISQNIESISHHCLVIEKVLEKEYSVRHVEEYIRYKALTGKYFVQAVEQYLEFTTELKNELKEEGSELQEHLIQFREQVQFIENNLKEIKEVLKSDRQNDLLTKMKSDTQLLRLKQNG